MQKTIESPWHIPEAAQIVALLAELMAPAPAAVAAPTALAVDLEASFAAAVRPRTVAARAEFVVGLAAPPSLVDRSAWGARPVKSFLHAVNWSNATHWSNATTFASPWASSNGLAGNGYANGASAAPANGAASSNGLASHNEMLAAAAVSLVEPLGRSPVGRWFAATNWTNAARALPAPAPAKAGRAEKAVNNRLNVNAVLSGFDWN
ncbi:MAG TPA: hypothetical protein VGE52_18100 [Pirellulales bacterium]